MRQSRTDVLLLTARGDMDAESFARQDAATYGARSPTKDLLEILLSEQFTLLASLLAQAANAVSAEHVRASDLIIALTHHRKPETGHRAVLERATCACLAQRCRASSHGAKARHPSRRSKLPG